MSDEIMEETEGVLQRLQGLENRMDRLHEKLADEVYALKMRNAELEKRVSVLEKKL